MSEEIEEKEAPDMLVYDLAPAIFEFGLRDPVTREVRTYTMTELNGTEREAYLNSIVGKFEVTSSGKSRVKNFTGLQSNFLAKCVRDDAGVLVPTKVIDKWPSGLQSELYKRGQRMSGMDETAEEDAKND